MAKKSKSTTSSKASKKSSRTKKMVSYLGESSSEEEDSMQVEQPSAASQSSCPSTRSPITNHLDESDESNDSSEHDSESTSSKSLVWNYAAKSENGKAKCLKCNKEVSYKDHSTTSLRRHLHRCQNLAIFASKKNILSSQVPASNEMKQKINDLVYKCIVQDGRSFGDLRKQGMARLLQEILPGKNDQ
jgi:hypothetical protein